MTFDALGLSDPVLRAVAETGYTQPTPIQEKAIPTVLMGRDMVGLAQTGTGKTAGFTLPMIDILAAGRAKARMPRSLILEPTRELAAQVERGKVLLRDVKVFVIDEADRMLDMGFIPDIERVVKLLTPLRQTLLFSATMPPEIRRLADAYMINPKEVAVDRSATTAVTVSDAVAVVPERDKRATLRTILRAEDVASALVFCNRKRDVDILKRSLDRHGFDVAALHGDLAQEVRTATLDSFREARLTILVASDVAARGLDIPDVSHVINFDVPYNPEDYVHRIGRTGRAGKAGRAITIATPADGKSLDAIQRLIGRRIERLDLDGALDDSAFEDADRPRSRGRSRSRGNGRSRAEAAPETRKTAEKPRPEKTRQEKT
ncbi:MAG: DEAD/DEAH box helicase, partial [Rhodospirillaceae bacterium]|nr:DEAD/DEAH box helicase [Rhodospirillaceae bacterium]